MCVLCHRLYHHTCSHTPTALLLTRRGSRPAFSLLAVSHPTFLAPGAPRRHTKAALSAAGVPLLPMSLGTCPLHPVAVHRGQPLCRPQTRPDATRTPKRRVTFTQGPKWTMGAARALGPRQPEDTEAGSLCHRTHMYPHLWPRGLDAATGTVLTDCSPEDQGSSASTSVGSVRECLPQ